MGVSLLSLLVVVVMLGAMASLAVVAVKSGETSASRTGTVTTGTGAPVPEPSLAERAQCESSAATIESAALAYFVAHDQTWPPDIAALTDATPPYIKGAPDPKWNLTYDNTTGHVDAASCGSL